MMKKVLTALSLVALTFSAAAQSGGTQAKAPEYKFTTVVENPITSIKNQSRSGTCWCFSALSFLESEAIRINNIKDPAAYPDFSEMFVVSKSYKDRAIKYIRTDGNINFAAGSEFDDVLHVIEDYGLVPQSAMPGLQKLPQHTEVDAVLKLVHLFRGEVRRQVLREDRRLEELRGIDLKVAVEGEVTVEGTHAEEDARLRPRTDIKLMERGGKLLQILELHLQR